MMDTGNSIENCYREMLCNISLIHKEILLPVKDLENELPSEFLLYEMPIKTTVIFFVSIIQEYIEDVLLEYYRTSVKLWHEESKQNNTLIALAWHFKEKSQKNIDKNKIKNISSKIIIDECQPWLYQLIKSNNGISFEKHLLKLFEVLELVELITWFNDKPSIMSSFDSLYKYRCDYAHGFNNKTLIGYNHIRKHAFNVIKGCRKLKNTLIYRI